MLRLIAATGLRAPLEAFVRTRPVLGTCAGVILLGHGGAGLPAPPFGVLDVSVERNAYGRQIDSFHAELEAPVVGGTFHGVFIRAPRITRVGDGVEVVARRVRVAEAKHEALAGAKHEALAEAKHKALAAAKHEPLAGAQHEPVGVRAGRIVGLCFHPELTSDLRFHRWFLTEVAGLRIPGGEAVAGRATAVVRGGGGGGS